MRDDVTQILSAIEHGDAEASRQLLPLIYDELRRLANHRLARESCGQTLQATALVHEAYLRLVGPEATDEPQWDGCAHFFGAAAEAMRRILIDRARSRGALKRGGAALRLKLDPDALMVEPAPLEVLDLDGALVKLAAEDPAKAELVQLRFFAGLSLKQAAAILGISPTTADRHWAYAKAWLYNEMGGER